MRFLSIFIFFVFTYLNSSLDVKNIDSVKKIFLKISVNELNGKIEPFESKFEMCYYKGYTLIILPGATITQTFQSNGKSKPNIVFSDENISMKYFLFSNNSDSGLSYDSLNQVFGSHFSADSLLKSKAFKEAKFYRPQTDIFVKTIKPVEKETSLVEMFIRPSSTIKNETDTLIIHYTDSLNDIPYSLSTEIDAMNKGKVYKIEYCYLQEPKNKSSKSYHHMKAVFEYQKLKDNDVHIIDYFKKFIRETKKN